MNKTIVPAEKYAWAVIGAGPAGIATIGKLLDHGILPEQILWIDPHFKVGDFGSKWRNVPSNTKVKLFTNYLLNCKSFTYTEQANKFALNQLNPDKTCLLSFMVEPLQWITDYFKQRIIWRQSIVKQLELTQRCWKITLTDNVAMHANNVVLAIGAEPKTLTHQNVTPIALEQALDSKQLLQVCDKHDSIAVFGSSHSAIMAIQNLVACKVKNIINFYRAPLRYAIYLDDWILFDDTGLKGTTAEWARNNIDGQPPAALKRFLATEENIQQQLPLCTKVIHAIGFEPRQQPYIEGFTSLTYNKHNGILAPGLFGLGIAYPEAHIDRFGNLEYRVGLWKFMDYLNRIMPVWLKYSA